MADALAAAGDAARARAALRLRAVDRARALLAEGHSRFQAESMAAEEHRVSRGSVMRWLNRAAGSAEHHAGPLLEQRRRGRPARAWSTPGAEEAWLVWRKDYLRRSKPGLRACWERVRRLARLRGWTIPSERTFRLRLYREVPPEVIVRLREGREAMLHLHPHQVRSVAGLAPLDAVSGDGRRHDVFVEMPSGRTARPQVWYWQDVRTRKILGWEAGETESQDLVRMAFVRMMDAYGKPGMVVVDNTFAASSKWWSANNRRGWKSDTEALPGIFDQLGIRVVHTHVEREDDGKGRGWGQAKPVERAFVELAETIDRHPLAEGAYTGRSTEHKPANYRTATLPWETFLDLVADEVEQYNARGGRDMEAAAGRSIDEAWAEEIATVPVHRPAPAMRALLLLACESTAVKRDGTFTLAAGRGTGLPRNRYFHESLRGLMHRRADRRRVVARFDPRHLHAGVEVFDLQGRWLCRAECLLAAGFNDDAAAREHNRALRRHARATQEAVRALEDAEDLRETYAVAPRAERAPEPAPKVVQLPVAGGAEARAAREDRFARGLARAINED